MTLDAVRLLTAEDYFATGVAESHSSELVDGRVVPVSPSGLKHADLVMAVAGPLSAFVRQRRLGRVVVGDVGLITRRNPDRVRGADVAFFSRQSLAGELSEGFVSTPPDLVAELAVTEPWSHLREKIEEHFEMGVPRVWVVEAATRCVLVFRTSTEFEKFVPGQVLAGDHDLQGLNLPVEGIFALPE